MKNENIKTKISLFIFLPFLAVVFFCFGEKIFAQDNHPIIIRTVQTSGTSSNDDFIELYNTTCKDVDLSDWKIMKKTKTGTTATSLGTLKKSIPAKGYFLWENTKDSTIGIPDYATKTYYLSDDYSIALFDKDEKQIDSVTWGENQNPFENTLTYHSNPKKSEALRRSLDDTFSIKQNYSPNNSSFIETTELALCQKEDPPTKKTYSDKIYVNELLPAPSADSSNEEFIELYNPTEKDEDISDWILRDGSKTGKYIFPENTKLKSKDFLVVYKKDFKFALNNSGEEKVLLFDPDEKEISRVEYSSAKTDYVYAFNGSAWQWTSKATAGAKNEFDKLLSGKIKKDKNIYVNVYANFEAKADNGAKKFTWNFGDGHKSYLKKTRHKYEKSGAYEATLKITGEGEDNLLNFTVKVEKYGKAKVRIVSLSPNPKGKDSENEWIEILNDTKKKVDLKGWSIATGLKKLYNHPVTKKFILKAGETKKLTREFCAFALGNKQAKIELRYPNGKVADKIKYDHGASISEDELYQKENNDWQWAGGIQKTAKPARNATHSVAGGGETSDTEIETPAEPEIIPADSAPGNKTEESKQENADFDLSDLGKYSEDPAWQEKQKTQIVLLFAKSNIDPEKFITKNQEQVLGISTAKFSPQNTTNIKSSDHFWKKINAKLNQFILLF